MTSWIIKRYDGSIKVDEWTVPGSLSEEDISALLQRLVSTTLSPAEVIAASLPRDDPDSTILLQRIGTALPLHYGENPFFTAEIAETLRQAAE